MWHKIKQYLRNDPHQRTIPNLQNKIQEIWDSNRSKIKEMLHHNRPNIL